MKLFYREFGQNNKKTLIILHGLFGMSDNWVSFGKILAKKYRIIIPDLRNHGQSMHHNTFTYEAMISDIEELKNDLNINKFNILGHSMGGKLGMLFALNNSEIIQELIVADISPVKYPPSQHLELLEIMNDIDFSNIKSRKDIESHLSKKFTEKKMLWFIMKNIKMITQGQYAWKLNIKSITENINNIFEFNIPLCKFSKNTLFLKGEHSDFILKNHHESIFFSFPKAKIITIKNTGHWLHADRPEQFREECLGFLSL